jgi:purine-cytosine permease-like protein
MSALSSFDGLPMEIKIIIVGAVVFHVAVFGAWFFLVRKEIVKDNKEKQM